MNAIARTILTIGLLATPVGAVVAQDLSQPTATAGIELTGSGVDATTLTRESLSELPAVSMDVAFTTSSGERRGRYEGVLLWAVLERAGLLRTSDHNSGLRRTFLVTGRDGYAIAFSVGEIAPAFGNTPVMIALGVDGGPLPADEGLRLIVPGDERGARNVRDVVRIEVR